MKEMEKKDCRIIYSVLNLNKIQFEVACINYVP